MPKYLVEIPELKLAEWKHSGTSLEIVGTHTITEDELRYRLYNSLLESGFKGGHPVVRLNLEDIKVQRGAE